MIDSSKGWFEQDILLKKILKMTWQDVLLLAAALLFSAGSIVLFGSFFCPLDQPCKMLQTAQGRACSKLS